MDRLEVSEISDVGPIPTRSTFLAWIFRKAKSTILIMKFEFSAGGVVFKRGPSALKKARKKSSGNTLIEILVAQHSYHHGWVFPKGLIGDKDDFKGQSKEETAVREVKEETGVDARIIEEIKPVTYWYMFEDEKIKKTVYYYIMEHTGGDITQHDTEMEDVSWIPVDEVLTHISFKSDKEIFKKALPRILELANS